MIVDCRVLEYELVYEGSPRLVGPVSLRLAAELTSRSICFLPAYHNIGR